MSLDNPPQPTDEQANPYLPAGPGPLVFEEFAGINTNTTRAGVEDKQMWLCDGYMPLDRRNLRTLYGVGTTLYTQPGGTSVVCFSFFNLGALPYCIVFLANGQVDVVRTDTRAVTTIMVAGTITSPTIQNVGITQWGRSYVVIVANQTNGYWIWDGAFLYGAGTLGPQIAITNPGSNYTSPPTVAVIGGHGTGASIVAFVSAGVVSSLSIVNPGQGYLAQDVGNVSVGFTGGQTSGTGGSVVGFVFNNGTLVTGAGGGTLGSVSIVAGGSGYGPNVSTSITPSIGFGGAAVALFEINGTVTSATITNPGVGTPYHSGSVTITVEPGANVTASATISLMPFGIQGTAAQTYTGHVWVASGPSIFFTAPGSVNDFASSDGGGNIISSDSFLRQSYTQLIQANGFLYLFGDSSINYIYGVTTSGTPPVTQFTNQNADPQIGTPYADTADVFGRNIVFANSFGVHLLYGGAVSKIGDELNGIWPTAATLDSFQLSAGTAVIFNRRVQLVLTPIVDPLSGSKVNKVLMWDGKRWFSSSQEISLNFIASQEINSVITAYGTNGTIVAPLFQTPSTGFTKTVQTRLWDAPGGYQLDKTSSRWWGVAQYYSTVSPNLTLSIDNEVNAAPNWSAPASTYTITGPVAAGYFVTGPMAIGQRGVLTGWTLQTTAADMTLISGTMAEEVAKYRG